MRSSLIPQTTLPNKYVDALLNMLGINKVMSEDDYIHIKNLITQIKQTSGRRRTSILNDKLGKACFFDKFRIEFLLKYGLKVNEATLSIYLNKSYDVFCIDHLSYDLRQQYINVLNLLIANGAHIAYIKDAVILLQLELSSSLEPDVFLESMQHYVNSPNSPLPNEIAPVIQRLEAALGLSKATNFAKLQLFLEHTLSYKQALEQHNETPVIRSGFSQLFCEVISMSLKKHITDITNKRFRAFALWNLFADDCKYKGSDSEKQTALSLDVLPIVKQFIAN
jgi:hypothetical protein